MQDFWHTHCRMNCSYSNEQDTAHMAIVAIVTVNSAMFEAKGTKIYPQNAGSLSITIQIVFTGHARPYSSVTQRTCWCPTMYSGQWRKSTSLSLWSNTQSYMYLSKVYIIDAVLICKTWTVSYLRCLIAMAKVLFPH